MSVTSTASRLMALLLHMIVLLMLVERGGVVGSGRVAVLGVLLVRPDFALLGFVVRLAPLCLASPCVLVCVLVPPGPFAFGRFFELNLDFSNSRGAGTRDTHELDRKRRSGTNGLERR